MGRGETGKEEESRDSNRHRKSKSMYALEVRTHTHTERERETPGKISGRPTGELEDDIIEPLGSGEAQLVLSSFCSFLPSSFFFFTPTLFHASRVLSTIVGLSPVIVSSLSLPRILDLDPSRLTSLFSRPDQTRPSQTHEPVNHQTHLGTLTML